MTRTKRELSLILPFYAGLTLLFTWPLATRLFSHVPVTGNGVDALSGLYALTWGIHALANAPFDYFQSNVFYPHAESLAFGDHLFGMAATLAPLQWTLANPTLTYNVGVLLSFVIAAAGAYLLARQITGSVRPGLLAGLLYGFSATRFAELGRLDALALHGLPWIFLLGHLYLESKRRRLIYLGAFFTLVQGVSSTRSLSLLAVSAALAFSYSLYRQRRRHRFLFWRHRVHFLTAFAIFLLGLAPFVKPYLTHHFDEGGWGAPVSTAEAVAVAPEEAVHKASTMSFPVESALEDVRSPGFVALLLIVLLVVAVLRRDSGDDHRVYFYSALGAFALLLGTLLPIQVGALVSLCAAVLAAISCRFLERTVGAMPAGNALVSGLIVLAAVELHPRPVSLHESVPRQGPPEVYLWLAGTEPEAIVIELPSIPDEESGTIELARRQYYSVYHWRSTVDGVTDRVPSRTRAIRERLRRFPDERSIAQIRALHVDYAVVHWNEYPAEERRRVRAELSGRSELVLEKEFGETSAYRVE